MAQFNEAFDANTVEPNKPFEAIPNGKYPVIIKNSKWEKTKKGDGAYLELVLEVIGDGPYKNRKLWDRLNLSNPSMQAVEIAQKTLSAICHATGVMKVTDSSQLHNIPMIAAVVVKAGPNDPNNEIKGYTKLDTVVGATEPLFAPPTSAAPPKAPWAKSA